MFKWLGRHSISPRHVCPGDKVTLMYHDEEIMECDITEEYDIDEVGVAEFTDEFGVKRGIVGFFGERE